MICGLLGVCCLYCVYDVDIYVYQHERAFCREMGSGFRREVERVCVYI